MSDRDSGSGTSASCEAKPLSARVWFWASFAMILLFGTVFPTLKTASQFSTGYFQENDLPIVIVLTTILVGGYLTLLALATWIFRLRVRMTWIVLAFAVHLATAAAGIEFVRLTFEHMVRGSVARAQDVVDAIQAFERERGHVPAGLKALVPDFLRGNPELLYENGPGLYYESDPTTAAWSIQRHTFIESIGLEYAPGNSGRALTQDERRIGDWIVWSQFPDGGASNLYEVFEPFVSRLMAKHPSGAFAYE